MVTKGLCAGCGELLPEDARHDHDMAALRERLLALADEYDRRGRAALFGGVALHVAERIRRAVRG